VPEGVVHGLEAVEVEKEQREVVRLAPRLSDRMTQAVVEQAAVGQAGQVIVMREIAERFVRPGASTRGGA